MKKSLLRMAVSLVMTFVLACPVTVCPVMAGEQNVRLSVDNATLCIGESMQLDIVGADKSCTMRTVRSDNSKVVKVKKKGGRITATAVSPGRARISVNCKNKGKRLTLSCTLTVPKTELNKKNIILYTGDKQTLSLNNAGRQKISVAKVSTTNKSVVKAVKSGKKVKLSALSKGKATVSVKYYVAGKLKTYKCKVSVDKREDAGPTPTAVPTVSPSPTYGPYPTAEPTPGPYKPTYGECDHKYECSEIREASCTQPGYSRYNCTQCGDEIYKDFSNPQGHSYVNGVCIKCNEKQIPGGGGHVFGEPFVTEPTCTTKGYSVYRCIDGDYEYTSDITDELGHDYSLRIESEDTLCEKAGCEHGTRYYYTCRRCGKIGDIYFEKDDSLGHLYNISSEDAPTCVKDGSREEICIRCNDTKSEKIQKTEHRLNVAAVYEDGIYYECEVCHKTYMQEFTGEGSSADNDGDGNDDGDGKVVLGDNLKEAVIPAEGEEKEQIENVNCVIAVNPECDKDGTAVCYITRDNNTMSFEYTLPKLGHIAGEPVEENRVEPSCENDGGYETVNYCSRCGSEIVRSFMVIDKTGHKKGKRRVITYHSGEKTPQGNNDYRECIYYECENGCGTLFEKNYYVTTQSDEGVDVVYSSLGYATAGTHGLIEAEIKPFYTFEGWFLDDKMLTTHQSYEYTMTDKANHFIARTSPNFLYNTAVTYSRDIFDIECDTVEDRSLIDSDASSVHVDIDAANIRKMYSVNVVPNEKDARVSYSLNPEGEVDPAKIKYVDVNPQLFFPGVYEVYYKIEKENWRAFYGKSIVQIRRLPGRADVSLDDWVYGEAPLPVSYDSTNSQDPYIGKIQAEVIPQISYYTDFKCEHMTTASDITAAGSEDTEEGLMPTQAGVYYVKVSYPGNNVYEACSAVDRFEIKKAAGRIDEKPVARTGLIYNGTSGNNGTQQALFVKGSSSTGRLCYSLDAVNWSEDVLSGINAGDYEISYYVKGDRNHNDLKDDSFVIKSSIGKADGEVLLTAYSGNTCPSNGLNFSVLKNKSGGGISASSNNTKIAGVSGSLAINVKYAGVGEADITVKSAETANYKAATAHYKATFYNHDNYKETGGGRRSAATCVAQETIYYRCSRCKCNLSSYYNGAAALGHLINADSGVVYREPTCEEAGYKYLKCARCSYSPQSADYIFLYANAKGHKCGTEWTKVDGDYCQNKCSVCSKYHLKEKHIFVGSLCGKYATPIEGDKFMCSSCGRICRSTMCDNVIYSCERCKIKRN